MSRNLQIFISHASRDKTHVLRLERTLSQRGLRPWVDQQELAGGQQWSAELQRAISQSAALVLVVTPAALASDMVRREYREALAQRIPVLLLVLRRVEHLPEELARLPQVAWRWPQWQGEQKLLVALYDLGIWREEESSALGSQWPVTMLLSNEGRGAHGWQRFTVDPRAYTLLIVGNGLGIVLIVLAWLAPSARFIGGLFPASATGPIGPLGILLLNGGELAGIFLLLIQVTAFASYRFKWWPPEAVLVTDSGITTNLFRFRWARAGVESRHYPFSGVDTIEQRRALFGTMVLSLRTRDDSAAATIWLPRRLTRGSDVGAAVYQALGVYQDSRRPAPAKVQADAHVAPTLPSSVGEAVVGALPVRAPRYVVLAGPGDLRTLAPIQQQLAWRGVYQTECVQLAHPEALVMPTASGASQAGFALVFVSKEVLRSAWLQPIVTDLLARGVLVIPVVLRTKLPMPPLLAQLQWVDFSPRIDPQRSRCDLLNALDAAGVPLSSPPHSLDGDLILARAMHDRPQPDWNIFQVHPQTRPVYRLLQVSQMAPAVGRGCVLPVLVLVLVAVSTGTLVTLFFAGFGSGSDALGSILALLVFVCAAIILAMNRFQSYRRWLAGASAYGRLTRNAAVPEMVVVTPSTIVVHTLDRTLASNMAARTPAFGDHALSFAAIRAIERRRGLYMPIRLRCLLWDGHTVEFGLPGQLVDVDGAAATIEQRWREYTQQHSATAPAMAPGAS